VVAALIATIAVVAVAAPGDAHAVAWKDQCSITIYNHTDSIPGVRPVGPVLLEIPPNPLDEGPWLTAFGFNAAGKPDGFPLDEGVTFTTIGIPVTWGCVMRPVFKWDGRFEVTCNVAAPSSGRNTFKCSPQTQGLTVKITTDNADIKGTVTFDQPPVQLTEGASGLPPPPGAKRVRALLRRRDLPGRGWRVANKPAQFGRLGTIIATNEAPASCKDDKTSQPLAQRGGASAFARGSTIIGYEHGVYATSRQSRGRVRGAVSTQSIRCLARLLTSARLHTRARFARYYLPGSRGVKLWRVVVRTRMGNRITQTDYLDVAGLLHRRSNGLVLFANAKKPVRGAVEQSEIRTIASRLP
jgi:hypothetical protein